MVLFLLQGCARGEQVHEDFMEQACLGNAVVGVLHMRLLQEIYQTAWWE